MIFKFPGDPRKLRERSKMKLWRSFLTRCVPPLSLSLLSTLPKLTPPPLAHAQNTGAT